MGTQADNAERGNGAKMVKMIEETVRKAGGQRTSRFSRRTLLTSGLGVGALFLAGCLSRDRSASTSSAVGESDGSAEADGEQDAIVSDLPPAPKRGHPAPQFTLATLGGGEVALADLRGKPVILNFWASWCGPCRIEMPHLQKAHEEQGKEVAVVGINLTQRENSFDDVSAFVGAFGLSFPVALDEEGDVAKLYEVRGQPASVFINADGTIHTVFYGPVTQDFIEEQIAELKKS